MIFILLLRRIKFQKLSKMRHLYKKIKNRYNWGERLLNDPVLVDAKEKSRLEIEKNPIRTDIINHIIHFLNKDNVNYLEKEEQIKVKITIQ